MSTKRRGPEIEWWVEVFTGLTNEKTKSVWEFHSIHETKAEAVACAEQWATSRKLITRVVEIARYPLMTFERGPAAPTRSTERRT